MAIFVGPLLQQLNSTTEAKYTQSFFIKLILIKLGLSVVSTFFGYYQELFLISSLLGTAYVN